jgi:aspartyl/asparaginyl beta-hydroxylase (cupin superfamily)
MMRQATERLSGAMGKLFLASAGGSRRPVIFDIDDVYPQLRILTRGADVIRRELDPLLAERARIPRYHDVDGHQESISGTEAGAEWRVFMLCGFGEDIAANADRCPETMALVRQVPNVVQAFFSILEPGKSVPRHRGPMGGLLRYHLGLKVPKANPPTFHIHDRTYVWQEGEDILFDDTWDHAVVNAARDLRAVLIVDVLRPMPALLHALNWLYVFLGARLYYLHGILLPSLRKLSTS